MCNVHVLIQIHKNGSETQFEEIKLCGMCKGHIYIYIYGEMVVKL